jgi:predicted transcriptional regulator
VSRAPKKSVAKRPGPAKEGAKLAAQLLLAQGVGTVEAAKRSEIGRTTLWRLMHGEDQEAKEFRTGLSRLRELIASEAADDVVAQAVKDLRDLAPEVIEAFRKGLAADVRYTALKGEDGGVVKVPLPDVSLAVKTADIVSKRITELVPQSKAEIEHSGTLEHRIREWRERGIEPSD